MSEIENPMLDDKGAGEPAKGRGLWLAAVVILCVVFVPALVAWGLSLFSSR